MRRLLVPAVVLCMLPPWLCAQRSPRIWLDSTALAKLRHKVSTHDADWVALKNQCDSLYYPASVHFAYDTDLRYQYNTAYANQILYGTTSIGAGYQGGSASGPKSLGYYDAVLNLGICYQAVKDSDPTSAARYAARGVDVLLKMSRPPGIITLADGSTRVIGDTTWTLGTAWPPSGVQVDGAHTTYATTVHLKGLIPNGTIPANDNFLINGRIYTVKTATTANAAGKAAIVPATAPSAQNLPTIQNTDAVPSPGYTGDEAVTTPLAVYSILSGIPAGTPVTISGVTGNTAVNGSWTVELADSDPDRLVLVGSNAVGTSAVQTNLAWQPLVNSGYGVRFYGVAMARGYDWFYDAMTTDQRAQVRADLIRWYQDLKRFGYPSYGMQHPAGNYFAGDFNFLVALAAALDPDDPDTSASAWNEWYNTYYAGTGTANGGGPDGDWVQQYFSKYIKDAFFPDGANYGWFATENILEAILTANSFKSLNLFASPAPAFTWPQGLAKTILHHAWPNRAYVSTDLPGYNSRGVSFGTNSGLGGNALGASASVVLSYILNRYGFDFAPYFQSFLNEMVGTWSQVSINMDPSPYGDRRQYGLLTLFYDAAAQATPYSTLAPSQYSEGWSEMAMRSDWSTSAVWANFNAGPWIEGVEANKLMADTGNLAITRGATRFLVNAPNELAWNNMDGSSYYLNSSGSPMPAPFNIFFADHPGRYKDQFGAGPGNQHKPNVVYPCVFSNASTISERSEQGAYVYARGVNLEQNYPVYGWTGAGSPCDGTRSVTHWTRDVLYIRPKLFIVRDWTTVPDASKAQYLMWHFGKTPVQVSAPEGMNRFNVSDGGTFKGALLTVAPASHTVAVQNPPTGFGTTQMARIGSNAVFQVQVIPPPNTASNAWVSVFDAASSSASVWSYSKLASTGADALQVSEIRTIVAFPASETFNGTLSYTFTLPGTLTHYVAGLAPGVRYTVIKDGSQSQLTADSGGVLVFTTTNPPSTVEIQSPGPQISTASPLPEAQVLGSYSAAFATEGGLAPYTYAVSDGSLPSGLLLAPNGTLSGIPLTGGTSAFTVTVTDANGVSSSRLYILKTNWLPLAITTVSAASGITGTAYSQPLLATGGDGTYNWSVRSGSVPPGLLVANGLLAGTPTLAGSACFTLECRSGDDQSGQLPLCITVAQGATASFSGTAVRGITMR